MPAASIAVVLATAQPFTKRLFDLLERPVGPGLYAIQPAAADARDHCDERPLTRSSRGFY